MPIHTVLGQCGYCGGSGSDTIAGRCRMCGGSGKREEQVWVEDNVPTSGSSGPLTLGLAVIAMLAFGVGNYILTGDLVSDSWEDFVMTRETDWTMVGIVAAVSIILVAIVARVLGVIAAVITGLIPALPAMVATRGGIGASYIIFHPEGEATGSTLLAWFLIAGSIAFHILLALMLQPASREPSARLFSRPRTRAARIACLCAATAGAVLLGVELAALRPYL